jgi:hypothetical protein
VENIGLLGTDSNDAISSVKVSARDGACFYADPDFASSSLVGGSASYPTMATNDQVSPIRVSGSAIAMVYRDLNFSGGYDSFFDNVFLGTPWNDAIVRDPRPTAQSTTLALKIVDGHSSASLIFVHLEPQSFTFLPRGLRSLPKSVVSWPSGLRNHTAHLYTLLHNYFLAFACLEMRVDATSISWAE